MVEPKDDNLEKLLNEPQEDLKGKVKYVGFCTIFHKKKNKPLFTFDIMKGFTDDHGKAIALMKGSMGSMNEKLFNVFREFVNQTGDLNKEAKALVSEFDKKFRVLVDKN